MLKKHNQSKIELYIFLYQSGWNERTILLLLEQEQILWGTAVYVFQDHGHQIQLKQNQTINKWYNKHTLINPTLKSIAS